MTRRPLLLLLLLLGVLSAGGVPVLSLGPGSPAFPADAAGLPDDEDTLRWDGNPDRGVNINGTYTYGGAARFTADGALKVKAVLYYLTGSADDIFVHVNGESTNMIPGPVLDTTRSTGQGGEVWRRADLPLEPSVEEGADFWTCVIVRRHPAGQYPLTVDLGPIIPYRGGYITLPSIGPEWYQLTDPPFWTDRNWNIRAVVEYETGVEDVLGAPGPPFRHRVSPSPARDAATVRFTLPRPARVTIAVYDAAGDLVRMLRDDRAGSGPDAVTWDRRADSGARVPAGTYLYRLAALGVSATGRIVVVD